MSLTVSELYNFNNITGSVGIEMEVEFSSLLSDASQRRAIPSSWTTKIDGSLRNGLEYVLVNPISRTERALREHIHPMLDALPSTAIKNAATASTHVHLNARKMSLIDVASAATVWWLVEPYAIEDCGDERKTNRYAQPFSLNVALAAFNPKNGNSLFNVDRYQSLNLAAIRKCGSLENRCMRACLDRDDIVRWIRLLCRLQYDVAVKHHSPLHVIERFTNARDKKNYIEKLVGGLVKTPLTTEHVDSIEERAIELYDFACLPGRGKTWEDWQESVKEKYGTSLRPAASRSRWSATPPCATLSTRDQSAPVAVDDLDC